MDLFSNALTRFIRGDNEQSSYSGKTFMTYVVGLLLLVQIVLIILFLTSVIDENVISLEILIFNFVTPSIVLSKLAS